MIKFYLAFQGFSSSMGEPNLLTGFRSRFGNLIAFSSKEKRKYYIENYNSKNPHEFVVSVNRKQARQYCLGLTVKKYNEYVNYVESEVDINYNDLINSQSG